MEFAAKCGLHGVHTFAKMSWMLDLSRDENATCRRSLSGGGSNFLPRRLSVI